MSYSHRDRTTWMAELKEMREAEAREAREREEAERLERERPIREAEAAIRESAAALGRLTREKILTQVDDERTLDPATESARMTVADADEYNRAESQAFLAENPNVHWSPANIDALAGYFDRNFLRIVSRKSLAAAWERLSAYGLLESAPAPEPPAPAPEPVIEPAKVDPEQAKREAWDRYTLDIVARDQTTGQTYTAYQLDRCSAEEYRRVMFGERYTPKISTVIYARR